MTLVVLLLAALGIPDSDPQSTQAGPHRKVGRCVGKLPRPAPGDHGSARLGLGSQDRRHRALADPCLARDKGEVTPTGECALQPCAQRS